MLVLCLHQEEHHMLHLDTSTLAPCAPDGPADRHHAKAALSALCLAGLLLCSLWAEDARSQGSGRGAATARTIDEGASSHTRSASQTAAAPLPQTTTWGTPRHRARFFVSGHSLTDDPYAADIADIARGLGGRQAADYNQQIAIGSPIRLRTGMPKSLAGYSTGKNRPYGQNLDIRDELRTGASIQGDRYDTLVITENHNLLQNMEWENTVKQVRHFHEQLIAGNPRGRTFLHASWWDIDKRAPGAWLDTERAMAKAWECSAARINLSLAAENRPDRVRPLPTSLALAELVGRALDGQVPGVSASTPEATLDRIFQDSVHLTRLGTYYLALVTYAAVYERSPVGAPLAAGLSREQSDALQALAWAFTSAFYAAYRDPSMEDCNNRWMPPACERYWVTRKRPDYIAGCKALFQTSNRNNPLYHDARTDAQFWFPARP